LLAERDNDTERPGALLRIDSFELSLRNGERRLKREEQALFCARQDAAPDFWAVYPAPYALQ
jgi:hypothetical protein